MLNRLRSIDLDRRGNSFQCTVRCVPYDIEVKELSARHVATVRLTISPDRMAATFAEVLPEVIEHLQTQQVQASGPSFGIFYRYDDDEADLEAGFPTSLPVTSDGRVIGRSLDPGTFAVTWHEGSYRTIGDAHRAIEAWMKENGREAAGPPWEVYWEGPEPGRSPSEFRTEVGYPIR